MLCPWCHGKGIADAAAADGPAVMACPECGGCGILHCCEGLTEQPLPSPVAEDAAGHRTGKAEDQPGRPGPDRSSPEGRQVQ